MSHKDCPFTKAKITENEGKFIVVFPDGSYRAVENEEQAKAFIEQTILKALEEHARFKATLQIIMGGFYKQEGEIKKMTVEELQEVAISGFFGKPA